MEFKVKTDKQQKIALWLINNGVIYGKCSQEQQELLDMAILQKVAMEYGALGEKVFTSAATAELFTAYCLPDDIEIVEEQEQTFCEKEGIMLCEIGRLKTGWVIIYPNGTKVYPPTLGALWFKGYVHIGWVHNGKCEKWGDIYRDAFAYFDGNGSGYFCMADNITPSTATHSAWRKVSE